MTPEPDDFLALYREQAAALLVFFERRVDDPELAIDLLSETFRRALDHRSRFRGTTAAQLSAWVWTIAANTLSEYQRRVAIEEAGAERLGRERRELTEDEFHRVEEIAGRESLRLAAQRSLSRLPAEQREAVRLRIIEDLSYEQVAEVLSVSVDDARTHVWRALRRLSVALELEWDDEQP